ncbi:MAG: glycosyltransferase family 47 protein [Campylobacteraceae bacterium]|jgi:hypothetical protein|nr:glycosyltransferase family 47 protein [Campylobacteraceae bacterium]
MKKIIVFTPYYLSEDYERQAEIDLCLKKNIELNEIDRIFLIIDDKTIPPYNHQKLTVINIDNRPTYKDWIDLTIEYAKNNISIFANSDIYFDNSITDIRKIFDDNKKSFVAISRYEIHNDVPALHKNPQWSQDVWCIDGEIADCIDAKKYLNIPMGAPRCDNKVAYIFSINGYAVINPCNFIKTFHVHNSQIRSYNRHIDKRILGGIAYVYPSETLIEKSKLAYDIWVTNLCNSIEQIKINHTLFKKENSELAKEQKIKDANLIVSYDRNWQFPAITEQYAYTAINKQLVALNISNDNIVYFAFPWATLIDNMLWNKKNEKKTNFLKNKLYSYKNRLNKKYIITVCQHIRLMEFQFLFKEMGITDIFWSHTTKELDCLPEYSDINLHPFPLYPVQAENALFEHNFNKEYLYSFVGAKAKKNYLTDSRNIIIDELSKTNTGLIIGNDEWYFNKIVYDCQINEKSNQLENAIDINLGDNFKNILSKSIFSLCPSGTGPNSIRLWESMGFGAIPVIISNNLKLPGDDELWKQAAVFCKEDRESILALPQILSSIYADDTLMKQKRQAMSKIWNLYGIPNFVYDIKRLILQKINLQESSDYVHKTTKKQITKIVAINSEIKDESTYITTITTEIMLHPDKFCNRLKNERQKIETRLKNISYNQRVLFYKALKLRNLESVWDMQ